MQGAKLGLVNQSTMGFGGGLVRNVKNKAVLCKPLTLTKATYCKPHMQSKPLQTDVDDGVKREYVPVPIPVPVFVPMPMNMYSQVTPTPLSLPVPVPVPVFLPTTLQGAEQIIQTINELTTKEEFKPDVKPVKIKQEQGQRDSSESEKEDKYEPELDLEADFSPDLASNKHQMEHSSVPIAPALVGKQEASESPQPQPRKLGAKKLAVDLPLSCEPHSSPRSRLPLKSRYGINAWKRWALSPPDQLEQTKVQESSKPVFSGRANLLELTADQLNLSLCAFVREVCRPSGERYSPDSIFYLCLGIQQHLHSKGRTDDLFGDSFYQPFVEELDKILRKWKPHVLPDGSAWGRVEEQALWSSRQLGGHSPASLLRSLVYLNTKYLGVRSVEQHLQLSFASVYKPVPVLSKSETSECLHVPSNSQDLQVQTESRKRKFENDYNNDSVICCSVTQSECQLYQLYREKCPASLRDSPNILYLQPDPKFSLDGLWFSQSPLQPSDLESLLTRTLVVQDHYLDSSQQEIIEQEDSALLEDRALPTNGE